MFAGKLQCIHVCVLVCVCVGGWVFVQCLCYSEPLMVPLGQYTSNQMEESEGRFRGGH